MPRTTLDIAGPVFAEAERLAQSSGRSLGVVVSEWLAEALLQRAMKRRSKAPELRWVSQPMGGAKVDLEDKEAVNRILDQESARQVDDRRVRVLDPFAAAD